MKLYNSHWGVFSVFLVLTTVEIGDFSGIMGKAAENAVKKAKLYHDLGLLDKSEELYQKILVDNPRDFTAHYKLGCIQEELLEYKEAENYFLRAHQLSPQSFDTLYRLGSVFMFQDKLDTAEKYFLKCLDIKDSSRVVFNLGSIAYENKNWSKAIKYFEEATDLNPEFADTWYMLGISYQAQGKLLSSLEAIETAIMRSPDQPEMHFCLANIYLQLFRFKDAEKEYQASLRLAPDSPKFLAGLARYYLIKGSRSAAETVLNKIINLDCDNFVAKMILNSLKGKSIGVLPGELFSRVFPPYPEQFDREVINELKYCLPERLCAALETVTTPDNLFLQGLEMGCGSGIAGEVFSDYVGNLTGIGSSLKFLEEAKEKNIYSELIKGDIAEALAACSGEYDLFIAADAFLDIGDLSNIFAQVSTHSSSSSYFVFSIENTDVSDFVMSRTGAFAHSLEYINKLAKEYKFRILLCEECGCHNFNNIFIYVLRKA